MSVPYPAICKSFILHDLVTQKGRFHNTVPIVSQLSWGANFWASDRILIVLSKPSCQTVHHGGLTRLHACRTPVLGSTTVPLSINMVVTPGLCGEKSMQTHTYTFDFWALWDGWDDSMRAHVPSITDAVQNQHRWPRSLSLQAIIQLSPIKRASNRWSPLSSWRKFSAPFWPRSMLGRIISPLHMSYIPRSSQMSAWSEYSVLK